MSPSRLRECLDTLHWGASTLARVTGAHRNSVHDWLTGRVRIRPDLSAWIERLAAFHERNPPPPKPLTRPSE
jgi:plasmid maintenance system antidote protein VapI